MTFQEFLQWIQDKKIAILGAGVSNRPLITLLCEAGANLTVFDLKEAADFTPFIEELERKNLTCSWSLGPQYLRELHGFDLIFRSPAIMPYRDELRKEQRRGAIITSEIEVFMHLCPCEVLAVTGSDGKTTTSTLIAKILETQGYKTWLGGNIGRPLLSEVAGIRPEDKVVLELSSFQLISMSTSPKTAIITNISPNHLDIHQDYREYSQAKAEIFRHQSFYDRLIINGEDPLLCSFQEEAKGEVIWTTKRPFGDQKLFGLDEDVLFYQETPSSLKKILFSRKELALPGRYNAQNILSALASTWPLIDFSQVKDTLTAFSGVEHRVELIKNHEGVEIYNSSIDSSPTRTINSLSGFAERNIPVRLIAGGKDKNLVYDELGRTILKTCSGVYLSGDNAELIKAGIEKAEKIELQKGDGQRIENSGKAFSLYVCSDYEECLEKCLAEVSAGEVILFSPAGTSFDRFKNFEERGQAFTQLVQELCNKK